MRLAESTVIDGLADFVDLLSQTHAFVGGHAFAALVARTVIRRVCGRRHVFVMVGFTGVLASQKATVRFFFLVARYVFLYGVRTILHTAAGMADGSGPEGACSGNQDNGTEKKRGKHFHIFYNHNL